MAPFLQLICKIANLSSPAKDTSNPNFTQPTLPNLSLIQYLPRNGHTAAHNVGSTTPSTQIATDSLPAEEFSDVESSVDAGPDIIRHPDVLSPVLRKQLTDVGALRLLRVRADEAIDSSVLANSLQNSSAVAKTVVTPTKDGQEQISNGTGSWFGWLSPASNNSQTDSPVSPSPPQTFTLHDGKLGDQKVAVMTCLPLQ